SDGDVNTAQTRFSTAAEAGNPVAMFSLAQLLETQETPDLVGAYAWSSLAAVRGLNEAAVYRDRLEASMTSGDVLAGQAQARAWTEAKLADMADGNP
ncbi:hypothetical protein L0664_18400, partial [Octadecabacter sp. G9-8]|nr:hypothetical protein [Octadecabacter dasysiphoniae]